MLVLGSTKQKWNVIDYCVRRCECPVVVVQRDYAIYNPIRPVVSLAMDVNVHCDRAFTWLLKKADLPDNSQLYVVHITPKKTDKPDARRFLASLKPKCIESKRLYSMASALVSYNRGTIPDGIVRFCHDKEVATLIIAAKGDTPRLRLSSSITDECLRNSSVDIIVWQDDQTRRLATSRYIFNVEGEVPTPLRLAPWEDATKFKLPQPMDYETKLQDNSKKDEIKYKSNSHQQQKPDYPQVLPHPHPHDHPRDHSHDRPQGQQSLSAYDPKNSIPPMGAYDVPFEDRSPKKHRRKSSLTYNVYDHIAKGKNLLAKLTGDEHTIVEPLSP